MLIDGLPDDSALHRAINGGKSWNLDRQISWFIAGQAFRTAAYVRAQAGVKKHRDLPDWPATPWEESESAPKRYGKVAEADRAAALEYLVALAPQSTPSSSE